RPSHPSPYTTLFRSAISWTTTVEDAFPEHAATMNAQYKSVKLEDLLANRAGIRNDQPAAAYTGATARQQRESLVAWAVGANPMKDRKSTRLNSSHVK